MGQVASRLMLPPRAKPKKLASIVQNEMKARSIFEGVLPILIQGKCLLIGERATLRPVQPRILGVIDVSFLSIAL